MAKTDWITGEQVTPAKLNDLGTDVNTRATSVALASHDQSATAHAALRSRLTALESATVDLPVYVGLTIVELSTGNWSADVPSRAPGENPVEARGWSDPLGANGVATPANWQDEHDIWTVKTAP
jgi:hypothetical protein